MKKNFLAWAIASIGFILDQLTKYWVVQTFPNEGDTIPLIEGVFHFTYVTNPGAAWSLFQESGEWLRWFSLIVSLVIIFFIATTRMPKLQQVAWGFVLAGAVGNGLDRFLFGYVVDFLDFRLINFPVFNLADICINIGIFTILLVTFFPSLDPSQRR